MHNFQKLSIYTVWCMVLCCAPLLAEDAVFSIDVSKHEGDVNRLVFGNNSLGYESHADYGAGIWESRWKGAPVKEVIDAAKNIQMGALRFPGGGGANNYDWKKAIGKNRKEFLFGIDEFLTTSKTLGADPIYTVSYFTGNERDAAELVEYLNAPNDGKHKCAAERAKNGHSEPYKVKYFEIGNEVSAGNAPSIKTVKPEDYAQNYLKYYLAMKAIDPSVQIGVVLDSEPWARVVISAIGEKVDFGIIHVYPTPVWGKPLETMPARQIFDISLAQPTVVYQWLFDRTKALFEKYSGREVPLAITEFNGGYAQEKPVPYRHSLGCALVNAELLRVFLKPENNILMANYWNFVNEYWGMIANGFNGNPKDLYKPYYKRPNYYVFEMYAKHFGDILIKANVKSETYDISKYDDAKTFLRRIKTGTLIKQIF